MGLCRLLPLSLQFQPEEGSFLSGFAVAPHTCVVWPQRTFSKTLVADVYFTYLHSVVGQSWSTPQPVGGVLQMAPQIYGVSRTSQTYLQHHEMPIGTHFSGRACRNPMSVTQLLLHGYCLVLAAFQNGDTSGSSSQHALDPVVPGCSPGAMSILAPTPICVVPPLLCIFPHLIPASTVRDRLTWLSSLFRQPKNHPIKRPW